MKATPRAPVMYEVHLYNSRGGDLEVTIELDGDALTMPSGATYRFVATGTDPAACFGVEIREDCAIVYLPIKIKNASVLDQDRIVWKI